MAKYIYIYIYILNLLLNNGKTAVETLVSSQARRMRVLSDNRRVQKIEEVLDIKQL